MSQLGFIPPSPPLTSPLLSFTMPHFLLPSHIIKSAGQGAQVAEGYESLSGTGRKMNESLGGLELLLHLT